jgi:hypothetical protein
MEPNASPFFSPLNLSTLFNRDSAELTTAECSEQLLQTKHGIPLGTRVMRGIPFEFGAPSDNNVLLLKDGAEVRHAFSEPLMDCCFLVFAHSADRKENTAGEDGIISPMMGNPRLGETVAVYTLEYEDGEESSAEIRRRFQINEFQLNWGEGSFECVPCIKPQSIPTNTEEYEKDRKPKVSWGQSQTRIVTDDMWGRYGLWLYALENPRPDKRIMAIRLQAADGTVLLSGITACSLKDHPLRWGTRKKAVLTVPDAETPGEGDAHAKIDIDLGQIVSVQPALDYGNEAWESSYDNRQPVVSGSSFVVEYTAHPAARFYLGERSDTAVAVSEIRQAGTAGYKEYALCRVPEATQRVTLNVTEQKGGKPVPVKVHIHGKSGEYLPPMHRHRIPNPFWYEDYSAEVVHDHHLCTYIDGEAEYRLPLGDVFVEVSKGFEIAPVHRQFRITEDTKEIAIVLERVLPWRERGWVTADTHVHFLSPHTALLEGAAEGVNVVNLLASQWGELFTNIADFDGRTTLGSRETGGDGEFLVRVGTENRQHVLGHISLLGYDGRMILPLTTGGPEESALGDAIEETLSGWAERCRAQNGISILPHFPNPRCEGAAAIVSGLIDGVEMTSWGHLYYGINPYSLSDWYRYLNCGYHVPAVGGTDKMSADTAVGTVRTYARIKDGLFTYDSWKEAVRSGRTFVSYGPLMEFTVEGAEAGERIELPASGGTLQVQWTVATATVPVTRVELVVNGQTREVCSIRPGKGEYEGSWTVKAGHSCWVALRVRGCQPDKQEVVLAHSSAVMVSVAGALCFSTQDAVTILEQIEGAAAYVRTIGTKAEERAYKKVLMALTSAHRALHNRMHQQGVYHDHTVMDDHHR